MMNEFHLFKNGGLMKHSYAGCIGVIKEGNVTNLPRLPSAQKQHLYLVLCLKAIPLELALNFVISCKAVNVDQR